MTGTLSDFGLFGHRPQWVEMQFRAGGEQHIQRGRKIIQQNKKRNFGKGSQ